MLRRAINSRFQSQRRFWEHQIRKETDFINHVEYIHYNPVKHGLVQAPKDWEYSSFHRYVCEGIYDVEWGAREEITFDSGTWVEWSETQH
jgi:putative transposase